jgi:O-antigen ligase
MNFVKHIRENILTTGIMTALIALTCSILPYMAPIAGIRNNRIYLVGIVAMYIMAVLIAKTKASLWAPLLIAYTGLRLFFGATELEGTAIYIILAMSLIYYFGIVAYRQGIAKAHIYNTICIIALLNIAFAICQYFGLPLPKPGAESGKFFTGGLIGLMANPNEFAALLAICLPFFFRKTWAYCIPLMALGFVLARSTNGMLAGTIITMIWAILQANKERSLMRRNVKILAMCCGVMLLFAAFITQVDRFNIKEQMEGRGFIYLKSIQVAMTKPLTGWGFAQYEYIIPLLSFSRYAPSWEIPLYVANIKDMDAIRDTITRMTGTENLVDIAFYLDAPENNVNAKFGQAHNEYVEMYFIGGLIGLILMLGLVWATLSKGFRMRDKLPALSFTASCLTAIFFFTWQIIPLAVLTIAAMVMIHGHVLVPVDVWDEKG